MKSDREIKQAFDVFADDEGMLNLVSLKVMKEQDEPWTISESISNAILELLVIDKSRPPVVNKANQQIFGALLQ